MNAHPLLPPTQHRLQGGVPREARSAGSPSNASEGPRAPSAFLQTLDELRRAAPGTPKEPAVSASPALAVFAPSLPPPPMREEGPVARRERLGALALDGPSARNLRESGLERERTAEREPVRRAEAAPPTAPPAAPAPPRPRPAEAASHNPPSAPGTPAPRMARAPTSGAAQGREAAAPARAPSAPSARKAAAASGRGTQAEGPDGAGGPNGPNGANSPNGSNGLSGAEAANAHGLGRAAAAKEAALADVLPPAGSGDLERAQASPGPLAVEAANAGASPQGRARAGSHGGAEGGLGAAGPAAASPGRMAGLGGTGVLEGGVRGHGEAAVGGRAQSSARLAGDAANATQAALAQVSREVEPQAAAAAAAAGDASQLARAAAAAAGAADSPGLPSGGLAGAMAAAAWGVATASPNVSHEASLHSHPGSESFAQELGAQLSIFVREGVQQARLQLNPQEMGPVLVRIQLEGQTAQVHMAAEHAGTRQALEQAMPALAGQLREAGITLTGGGVFERPSGGAGAQGQGQEGGDGGAHAGAMAPAETERARAEAAVRPAPEPGQWSRARGIVDLVA